MVTHERSVRYLATEHHPIMQHLVWKMLVWYGELPLGSQLQYSNPKPMGPIQLEPRPVSIYGPVKVDSP